MLRVYNYMALGIAFTAIVTMALMSQPALMRTIAMGPMKWVLFAAVLGLGWFSHRLIYSGNQMLAHGAYWLYCALWGAMIAPMIFAFVSRGAGEVVGQAFAITAVTFGAVSLFGYTTKKNLSAFATFFAIAAIGLLVAMLVNAFLVKSTGMSLIVSCAVVLLFAAITAWETQEIKQMYIEGSHNGAGGEVYFATLGDLRCLHAVRQLRDAVHQHPEHPRHHAQRLIAHQEFEMRRPRWITGAFCVYRNP